MATDNEQNHLEDGSSIFILNCTVSVESEVTFVMNWTTPNDIAQQVKKFTKPFTRTAFRERTDFTGREIASVGDEKYFPVGS
jgi:hypothetical protein